MRLDHDKLTDEQVHRFIRAGIIRFAGSKSAKIYGSLDCESGKKMKREFHCKFGINMGAAGAGTTGGPGCRALKWPGPAYPA